MPVKSLFRDADIVEAPSWDSFILNGPASQDQNAPALLDSDTNKICTYQQMLKNIASVARGLHAFGVKRGDVVAVCLPNCMEYMGLVLAIVSRGAVFCGINANYTLDEFEFHITDCTAQFIFASKESLKNIGEAVKKIGGNQKIFVVEEAIKGDYPPGAKNFNELLSFDEARNPPPVSINPKTDAACMLYSSGTTGRPKGVMLSHSGLITAMQLTLNPALYTYSVKGDHVIGILPMFHIFGLLVSANAMRLGAVLIIMRKYNSEKYLALIQKYKVRIIDCVPPMIVFLAKDALVDKYDLTSVQSIVVGAAPVGKELSDEVMTRLPCVELLNQDYGMTEIGSDCMMTPKWRSKFGSCGMLIPNFQCKVIDVETRQECGPNQIGEIFIDGPTHMLGYFRNPSATAGAYDKDGWLCTGDIGYYDEDGYFFIVDRLKELIKVKGFQVSPAELEDLLLSHPAVDEAAVIPVVDSVAGELPKALVIKQPSAQVTEAELIKFVEERVCDYKRLRGGLEFVDAIPKSASGKILRRILREQEKEKHAKSKV